MQKIKQKLLRCPICKKDMPEENYPVSLKCGNILCLKCYEDMKASKSKCPFNKNHDHLNEPLVRGYGMSNVIDSLSSNKQNSQIKNDVDDDNSNNFNNIIKKKNTDEYQNNKFIFKGTLKNNKPFGQGKLIYDGIGTFKGEFNGSFHKGKGQIIYEDFSSYKGEWENFKRQNYGVLEFENGDIYEGEFNKDLFDGKGKLKLFDENITYEGFWREGKKFGEFNVYNEFDELIKKENYENDIKIS